MEIKKSTLSGIGIMAIALTIVAVGLGFLVLQNSGEKNSSPSTEVVSIMGDTQYIDISAKGGYSPNLIEAQAEIKTVLRVSTKNTFDCSAALTIPSLNVKENLPANGKTEISIDAQDKGSEIDGTCSMGMYGFKIKFI